MEKATEFKNAQDHCLTMLAELANSIAQRDAKDASWGQVGSLKHVEEQIAELRRFYCTERKAQ